MHTRRTAHRFISRPLALASVAALGLAACGGDDLSERAAEEIVEQQLEQDGQDVDIDIDEGGDGAIKIEGSGGDMELQFDEGGGVDLPADFPSEVPLPDGLSIESASSMDAPEGKNFIINGTVDGEFGEATKAYAAALEAAGFTQLSMTESTDGTFFSFTSDAWSLSGGLFPNPGGDGTSAGLTVIPTT